MGKRKNTTSSTDKPMTLQEAYRHLQVLGVPVRRRYIARLIGVASGETALMRFHAAHLLLAESDAGWIMPIEEENC